ncbi:glycoside hydrolase family 3 C-terminal domain-containing protein [Nocardioides sp. SOB77]|uniref:Glycoside hydrolase family 3 C-terminal domain-containing protein n=1 Tax=Nocardioides oceani TaxID=3058369 RepID=A0ABT8FHI3_9ACTN|nr:glycoside hydrolase family 3 C-terminal domain-containing protein [Nocardioides oceani]MDN4174153.1 glycoside hydrolase family 3 C-terminal domain-containing protein [Nocardioides oceani]
MTRRLRTVLATVVAVAAAGVATLAPVTSGGGAAQAAADPCAAWMDRGKSADQRARALVRAMDLEQKLHMVTFDDPPWFLYYGTAGHVGATPELCIPDLVLSDAGSGVAGLQVATTTFPSGVAQASTWDPMLQRRLGRAIGAEAHRKGINVMLAPGMNIARTSFGGRNFEYFGEDPHLAARTAVSVIEGIQDNPVLADAKHFAVNNQETDRMTVDARVGERALREIYLPAFEASVKEARVGSVMCAYNRVNGPYACENEPLLTDVLREDWGFDGFVVSDWGAVHSTARSAMAGLDLEMNAVESPLPSTGLYGAGQRWFGDDQLRAALAAGDLTRARLDDMVRNIVRPMFEHGLFDDPVQPGPLPFISDVSTAEHLALARRVAAEGTVLLKNRRGLLPLDRSGGRTIAVVGWAANPVGAANGTAGGGSSHGSGLPPRVVSPLQGILEQATRNGDRVVYVEGSTGLDARLAAEAADVVVVVATDGATEGSDRPDLGLRPSVCLTVFCSAIPIEQERMIEAATAANPRTVVVLDVGGPVRMPWLEDAGAVLVPWYGGLEHGNALADVLYGVREPGGRLPQTFPTTERQVPFTRTQYPGTAGRAKYSEGLLVGYRWFDAKRKQPMFPFGYGLGYTRFRYADLTVRRSGAGAVVGFRVTNTGRRAGADVPQVYVAAPAGPGEPPRQLQGFRKVRLAPGESTRVRLRLDRRAFAHWDVRRDRWEVDPGRYGILVGPHSRDLRLRGAVRMGG